MRASLAVARSSKNIPMERKIKETTKRKVLGNLIVSSTLAMSLSRVVRNRYIVAVNMVR
jgi:hypothetical protein